MAGGSAVHLEVVQEGRKFGELLERYQGLSGIREECGKCQLYLCRQVKDEMRSMSHPPSSSSQRQCFGSASMVADSSATLSATPKLCFASLHLAPAAQRARPRTAHTTITSALFPPPLSLPSLQTVTTAAYSSDHLCPRSCCATSPHHLRSLSAGRDHANPPIWRPQHLQPSSRRKDPNST